jgi:hypothetical protein
MKLMKTNPVYFVVMLTSILAIDNSLAAQHNLTPLQIKKTQFVSRAIVKTRALEGAIINRELKQVRALINEKKAGGLKPNSTSNSIKSMKNKKKNTLLTKANTIKQLLKKRTTRKQLKYINFNEKRHQNIINYIANIEAELTSLSSDDIKNTDKTNQISKKLKINDHIRPIKNLPQTFKRQGKNEPKARSRRRTNNQASLKNKQLTKMDSQGKQNGL